MSTFGLQINELNEGGGVEAIALGGRPIGEVVDGKPRMKVNSAGYPQIQLPRGIRVNSALRKDEWEELDAQVVAAATSRLNGVAHLAAAGLTTRLGGIGTTLSQWNTASEMKRPSVTINGAVDTTRDRQDYKLSATPVPVIHNLWSFDARELAAARNMGNALESGHAQAAARVVAEELERMLFLGNASIVLGGNTIYGLTNHPNTNTGSGSDWGTAGNAITTVAGMIADANGDGYFGPFHLYVATTQYSQARNIFFTDGSGDSQYDRLMRMAGMAGVFPCDWLTAGTCVLVQMDRNVVDLAFAPGYGFNYVDETERKVEVSGVTMLEWSSGDGMMNYFKNVCIAVPRVKADYSGKSGIVYYTGI